MTKLSSRLDLGRYQRLGMIEAIWGENKSAEQITQILESLKSKYILGFVTRLSSSKANTIKSIFPEAKYHKEARCLTLGNYLESKNMVGDVVIVSGGTSDLAVASESDLALRCHGINSSLLLDVGVAGLHRLLDNLDNLKKAKVLIVCAGMEGALPTVLAGLIPQPIIGLPVSVGYGVSSQGRAALEGMLSSCAPGLLVVNIDNGYGAAMAALRILNADKTKLSKDG